MNKLIFNTTIAICSLALFYLSSCTKQQNSLIGSETISNQAEEKIFYQVYQTGIDNYRFEFKSTHLQLGDNTELFKYFLNDANYTSMKFSTTSQQDTVTIKANFPTEKLVAKTKRGKVVIFEKK